MGQYQREHCLHVFFAHSWAFFQSRLRAAAEEIYSAQVAPAFGKLHRFMIETYIPKARESIEFTALPDGRAWYAFKVRENTTTTLAPEEIHVLGLHEVKRIRADMDALIAKTGFSGDFGNFMQFLHTDPRFFYSSAEELLTGFRDIAKRIDPQLIRLFGTVPRLPYGVKAIPSYAEQSAPPAYYTEGSLQAGNPSWFLVNTYAIGSRPKWQMECLTLHEAVPGHHLQLALAAEKVNLPEFRRYGGYTAFNEGWALYSESLGVELGLYQDPYSRFGALTFEMLRAVRLVVDTGMHSLGWSRQQSIDYMRANTGEAEREAAVEIDRYITWPGQALAYKLGQLKLRELRDFAQQELKDGFDLRRFHDAILTDGSLPLDILEQRMRAWVEAQRARWPTPPMRS